MNDTANKENSYSHVLKYTGIFGGVQGLNILIGLVRNKLVALILGPAGMGLASLYNTVVNFVSQATNLGISFSAVKHLSEIFDSGDSRRIEDFVRTVRSWSIVAAMLGLAVCVAAAPLLDSYVFDGEGHTLAITALAPVVAMTAVTGGETAILKGARRLRDLARAQIFMVAASLIISVPIYWLAGQAGIIPVILLITAANTALTLRYSLRLFPLRLSGARGSLAAGGDMVRLGMAFIMSGVFGSGAEMVVRSYLNTCADLDTVGLYNAGYMITITYAAMVFSAMETDYFPRLSAVNHDTEAVNMAANRQIEVSLLIISPMLVLMITVLPLLIPLLYSGKFAPVAPMAQAAALSMYAKAAATPVEYITLAKGHSKAYLTLELVFDCLFAALVIVCFRWWGLTGTGIALCVTYFINAAMIFTYARLRYGYRPSRQVWIYMAVQIPLGLAAYLSTFIGHTAAYMAAACVLTAASAAVSTYALYKKTDVWQKITAKLRRRR